MLCSLGVSRMLRPPGQPAALEAGPSRAVHARGTSLVWLRRDLRLDDNPALAAALKTGGAVVLVYVWAPGEEGQFEPGTCSRWWLFKSLTALSASVRKLGGRLILRSARKVCFHPLFRAAEQLPGRRKVGMWARRRCAQAARSAGGLLGKADSGGAQQPNKGAAMRPPFAPPSGPPAAVKPASARGCAAPRPALPEGPSREKLFWRLGSSAPFLSETGGARRPLARRAAGLGSRARAQRLSPSCRALDVRH